MCEVCIGRMVLWCDHVVNHDCRKKKINVQHAYVFLSGAEKVVKIACAAGQTFLCGKNARRHCQVEPLRPLCAPSTSSLVLEPRVPVRPSPISPMDPTHATGRIVD